ncbi:MAG: hypothetical protein ABIP71_09240 [Verrucomicrobiota bacterium]
MSGVISHDPSMKFLANERNQPLKLQLMKQKVESNYHMCMKLFLVAGVAAMLVAGCATPLPPGVERGPNGTMAYDVFVEASSPGVRIEANGEYLGVAPLHLKIFGDPDGTFHDFGSAYYQVTAVPAQGQTNQFAQIRTFQTGQLFAPQDRVPQRIYFNMSEPPPRYAPYPVYVAPPAYYDPFYYDRSYYGPTFRFDIGPRYHRGYGGHRHW